MRQNKTANEVAQKFGLTYAPVRVKMVEKKKIRLRDLGNNIEEVYRQNNIAVELTCIIAGCLLVAIVFVVAVFNAIGIL